MRSTACRAQLDAPVRSIGPTTVRRADEYIEQHAHEHRGNLARPMPKPQRIRGLSPDVATAYDLGANSFVSKPVGFDSLVQLASTMTQYWFQLVELPSAAEPSHG